MQNLFIYPKLQCLAKLSKEALYLKLPQLFTLVTYTSRIAAFQN